MDANETRFHLLLGLPDWERCILPDAGKVFTTPGSPIQWDNTTREVRLRSELFRFRAAPRDNAPTLTDRRGAAADQFLNWYWISKDEKEIRAQSSGEKLASHFWSPADDAPPNPPPSRTFQPVAAPIAPASRRLSGAAVTSDHFLVVGTVDPGGLLIFDLLGGGPPSELRWPIPFVPFDLIARPSGGVFILDRLNRRYWALDRNLRVITNEQSETEVCPPHDDAFQAISGSIRRSSSKRFPEGMLAGDGSPIDGGHPVSIEALRDGTVLILDAPPDGVSRVLRYRMSTCIETVELPFAAHDFAVCDDCLYVASSEGNQAFAFTISFTATQVTLEPLEGYFPMRRFGGKALVAAPGRAGSSAYYDFGEHWIPLVSQSYPRHVQEAVFQTQSRRDGIDHPGFDGKEPQCVWHRLVFDGCLPPGTEVEVWSRAADDERELVTLNWIREPDPYRRGNGSEQPYIPISEGRRGTFELLFQKACGRYLQLQVRLAGDGRLTPRIHAMRIYYPRFSYLDRYLPAVYRENKESASFLDRFLANIEGIATTIEDRIASAQILFDVQSAPANTLPWLASWFGVMLDPAWDEQRSRLFLRHAMTFFQWRGTVRGLKMALRLAFDANPSAAIFDNPECACGETGQFRVVEKFRTRRFPPVQLGNPSEVSDRPNLINVSKKWIPNDGASALHARFLAVTGQPTFTLTPSANDTEETARTSFGIATLGFVPSDPSEEIAAWAAFLRSKNWTGSTAIPLATPTDASLARHWRNYQLESRGQPYGRQRRLWQQFLARRYISVRALAESHGVEWDSFEEAAYPVSLPQNSILLRDWFEFESRVLPTLAAAHRFTVLLPVSSLSSLTEDQRRQQLALANRLIELEKPAHTTFDVKFFWAMFRVGEARLGSDSVLGLGARDPAFLHQLAVAGQSYLGESFLHSTYPPSLSGRFVTGRDRLKLKQKPQ